MAFILFFLSFNLYAGFSVATYNVQNYFEGKKNQIEKVIKAMENPDFLGLQEVRHLPTFKNYKIILSKIKDRRGMGVSFLYKKGELIRKNELIVPDSRSILEAQIKFKNTLITFFIVHWPSQRNPTSKRIQAAKILIKRINKLKNKYFFILGDFNFDPDFEKIPSIESAILKKREGTYFYIPYRQWRNFDRILWSKTFKGNFEYRVFRPDFISKKMMSNEKVEKIPWRYNAKTKDENHMGYSDHFPVYLKYNL